MPLTHHQSNHQPPPPNIGPGSNYFGGIMNAHGQQGLVAPPNMSEQPPNGPPPHGSYPPNQPPVTANPPTNYMNGSSQPPPSVNQKYGQSPRGIHTAPQQQQQQRQEWGSGYGNSYRGSNGPPPPQQQQQQESPNLKRKTIHTPPQNTAMMPRASQKPMSSPSTANNTGLADVDPESVPANMKVEGQDWFALFNPKAPRQLKVDLVHTLEHPSVVCCVKFSADGRYLAAGCNRATFIYDVATSQRVA